MKLTDKDMARLQALMDKAGNDAQLTLALPIVEKGATRWMFSCSRCSGTGDGPTPASIAHESCCSYIGGHGC
jgi:hypothetical protein